MTDSILTPYPWQQADIDHCVETMSEDVGGLITSAPGAGKTLVATEIAKRLGAEVTLIIAPQGTHQSAWGRTVSRQGLADGVRVLIGDAKGKKAMADLKWGVPGVYVTTPQYFARQDWSKIRPDMVIFDEIHLAGSYGIATSKKLIGHGKKPGLWAKYRLGLSGTPVRNKFENAWVLVRWLEPAKMELDYYVWRLVKCKTKPNAFAPQGREVIGEKIPGELFGSLSCYVYHAQRENCCDFHPNGFLAGLPEPLELEIEVEMTTAQRKFYREMEHMLASDLMDDDGNEVNVSGDQVIVARGYLRRCALALPAVNAETGKLYFPDDAVSPKLDRFIADLPTYEGKHTLVFTHSKQFAKVVVDRVSKAGYVAAAWHGDITKPQRAKVLKAFMDGEIEIIVGVIGAMGTGTDGLQEVCWNLTWLSYDDDASNNFQGLGRLDRLGQKNRVVTRTYNSIETIDVGFFGKQWQKAMKLKESLRKGDENAS